MKPWLVTTLGISLTAAASAGCLWLLRETITGDWGELKVAVLRGCSERVRSPPRGPSACTRPHIQSPLLNELYKFNHLEGCLVHHRFLVRVRGGQRLISSHTKLVHSPLCSVNTFYRNAEHHCTVVAMPKTFLWRFINVFFCRLLPTVMWFFSALIALISIFCDQICPFRALASMYLFFRSKCYFSQSNILGHLNFVVLRIHPSVHFHYLSGTGLPWQHGDHSHPCILFPSDIAQLPLGDKMVPGHLEHMVSIRVQGVLPILCTRRRQPLSVLLVDYRARGSSEWRPKSKNIDREDSSKDSCCPQAHSSKVL